MFPKKPAKIKKPTIIAPICDGRLDMIDIHDVHTAAKCSWLKGCINQSSQKGKSCMWYMLNVNENILNKNYSIDLCKRARNKFHAQILQLW